MLVLLHALARHQSRHLGPPAAAHSPQPRSQQAPCAPHPHTPSTCQPNASLVQPQLCRFPGCPHVRLQHTPARHPRIPPFGPPPHPTRPLYLPPTPPRYANPSTRLRSADSTACQSVRLCTCARSPGTRISTSGHPPQCTRRTPARPRPPLPAHPFGLPSPAFSLSSCAALPPPSPPPPPPLPPSHAPLRVRGAPALTSWPHALPARCGRRRVVGSRAGLGLHDPLASQPAALLPCCGRWRAGSGVGLGLRLHAPLAVSSASSRRAAAMQALGEAPSGRPSCAASARRKLRACSTAWYACAEAPRSDGQLCLESGVCKQGLLSGLIKECAIVSFQAALLLACHASKARCQGHMQSSH